jgi:hypothetical protein
MDPDRNPFYISTQSIAFIETTIIHSILLTFSLPDFIKIRCKLYKIRENTFYSPIFMKLFNYSGALHGDRLYRILPKSRETCIKLTNFYLCLSVFYDFSSTNSYETNYHRMVLRENLFTKFDQNVSRNVHFTGKNPVMLLITVAGELFL